MKSLRCSRTALLTWIRRGDGDQLEVAGRLGRSCIPSSIVYSWNSGSGGHLVQVNSVSSDVCSELIF